MESSLDRNTFTVSSIANALFRIYIRVESKEICVFFDSKFFDHQ